MKKYSRNDGKEIMYIYIILFNEFLENNFHLYLSFSLRNEDLKCFHLKYI